VLNSYITAGILLFRHQNLQNPVYKQVPILKLFIADFLFIFVVKLLA